VTIASSQVTQQLFASAWGYQQAENRHNPANSLMARRRHAAEETWMKKIEAIIKPFN